MIAKIIFLSILSLLFAIFNLYLYKRFIPLFTSEQKIKRWILYLLIFWQIGFIGSSLSSFLWNFRPFFAVSLALILFVIPLGVLLELAKRLPFFVLSKYALLSIFCGMFFYSFYVGAKEPHIKRVTVENQKEPLSGLDIAVLSDIHIDPSKKEFTEDIVKIVNGLDVDAVLLVGDLCDGKIDELKEPLDPLKGLKSRYGVFFAPGNHEYYYDDFEAKMEHIQTLGIQTLINQNIKVNGFWIAGVSDIAAGRAGKEGPDMNKTFADSAKPIILMAHQPKTAKEALPYSPDVVFCGHTHDGQIWPFRYLVSLVQPYVYGEYSEDKSKIFVTSGVGLWGPPMRLFSKSEILLVSFR